MFGCEANAQKLNITTIYSEPNRVTREVPETGGKHTYTTRKEVTERLNPMIVMTSKNAETLKFRIQETSVLVDLTLIRSGKFVLKKQRRMAIA